MIEFAALLLVSTLFGGMMLYSFGFAPMVFSALKGEVAGRFIRDAFPWYYLFVIVASAVSGAILLLVNFGSAALMLATCAVAIYARQLLMPQINAARDEQLQGNAQAKGRFGRLHGFSVLLNFVQLIAAGYVLYRFL
ncbi:MAG: DUF4149 domain-containing protein [Hyphomicrobiales bacterium]|nr:DUF4149 domain-containing protein [Hyphomicrobiales bacterium]MDE2114406.1 DUF4149 domain-containing protein [Hyphomicrobiales bacterium]